MNAIFINNVNLVNEELIDKISKLNNVKFFIALNVKDINVENLSKVISKLKINLQCIIMENIIPPKYIQNSFNQSYNELYKNKLNIDNISKYERNNNIKFGIIMKLDLSLKNYREINIQKIDENTLYKFNYYSYADSNTMKSFCNLVNYLYEYTTQNNVKYNLDDLIEYHMKIMKLKIIN